jgi:hypothetical protein
MIIFANGIIDVFAGNGISWLGDGRPRTNTEHSMENQQYDQAYWTVYSNILNILNGMFIPNFKLQICSFAVIL